MQEIKKVTVRGFSVFHTGPNEYRLVNDKTRATCSYHPSLARAFSAAQQRAAIEQETAVR